jgi:MFS transporter, DHA3 family, macrolide efflux protein
MTLRAIALIAALGIELFSVNVFFFYVPLLTAFGKDDQFMAAVYRSMEFIAPVLLGYIIGSIVDRTNKKFLGVSVSIALAVLTFYLAVRIRSYANVEMLVVLALISMAVYFLGNLRVTAMPLVIASANLHKANAAIIVVEQVAMLTSPAFAAILIYFDVPRLGLSLIGIAFLVSSAVYVYAFNGVTTQLPVRTKVRFWSAVAIFASNRRFLFVTLAVMGMNGFVSIFPLYVVIFAVESDVMSATNATSILAVSAVAGIIAGTVYPRLFSSTDTLLLAGVCCFSLTLVGVATVSWPSVLTLYLAAICDGLLTAFVAISAWTLRQTSFDSSVLGKITGITFTLFKGAMLVSPLVAGLASHSYGSGAALIVASLFALEGFIATIIGRFTQERS